MKEVFGLVVVGAGPAGMSAAIAAREHGADVLVLDEQAAPGDQVYRNVETVTAKWPAPHSFARFAGVAPSTRRVLRCGK